MRVYTLGLLLQLLLCITMTPLHASDQTTLRLATVDNFPPFVFMEQGRLTGVDVDVVHEMARRVGLQIEIEAFPWVRVIEFVKDGSLDGGFSAFMTEERKSYCLYTGVLHYEQFHVFVKKGSQFPFSSVKDLHGKVVGKDIGVYVSETFDHAVSTGKIRVEEVTDRDNLNLKKLSLGRIDAMIGDFGVTTYHASKMKMSQDIISLGPIHDKQAAYLILSKQSELPDKKTWQKKIRTAIDQIWRDGTYLSIVERYTPKN